jgi:predicted transcriptional regulator
MFPVICACGALDGIGPQENLCYDTIETLIGGCIVETKQHILKAIEELPDDASVEDAIDRLYLLYKIEKGLRQADRGELISQEEAQRRMAGWLK